MANSSNGKPSIVFAHGVWADGSCFEKVIPKLQAAGYEVASSQYGLDTVDADIAATKRTLGRVSSPAILVAHSYGGQVISAAGTDDRVRGLVYICAVAPDQGETVQVQLDRYPSDIFAHIAVADGRVWLTPDGVECFAADLTEAEKKLILATHFPPDANLFTHPLRGQPAWKTKPSWFIVGKQDRTVHPDLERFLAKRMGATVTELDTSHVPMLSKPDAVIDVILKAANSVH